MGGEAEEASEPRRTSGTTRRAPDRVNDRKKRWRGEMGNQFVDLLWSSGEGLGIR